VTTTPREIAELADFLYGTAPLDGAWFGEKHPNKASQFWWRAHMRKVLTEAATLLTKQAEDARDAQRMQWLESHCFINEYHRRCTPYAMLRIYTKHTRTESEYFQCADKNAVGLISVRSAIDAAMDIAKEPSP
jgi:hypothetical protein